MSSLKHKCAVCGVIGHPDSALITYAGLISLQHRGQGQFGICAMGRQLIRQIRRMGLVASSVGLAMFQKLRSRLVIGHNRYPTAGPLTLENAQPHLSPDRKIALCSNGDIVPSKYGYWKRKMITEGFAPISDNDGELLLCMIRWLLSEGDDIITALQFLQLEDLGAFSLLVIYENQMFACRDRRGFRPLVYGGRNDEPTRFVASESCAMVAMGADYWEEIEPGETRVIHQDGSFDSYCLAPLDHLSQCSFELIYFDMPTSESYGIPVDLFREETGEQMGDSMPPDADFVTPVPDSANFAAEGLAHASGVRLRFGLVRPHHQGRSFIAETQAERAKIAHQKQIPAKGVLGGNSVVCVDDSIVRGTTSNEIVTNMRKFDARLIHLRIVSPPVRFPCFYGISTPTKEELIANGKTVEEICQEVGADSLAFLPLERLKAAIAKFGKDPRDFCFACFDGQYPIPL